MSYFIDLLKVCTRLTHNSLIFSNLVYEYVPFCPKFLIYLPTCDYTDQQAFLFWQALLLALALA